MLKAAAMFFLAAGFAFGGRCLASIQRKKASVIGDVLLMLSVTETHLRYVCLPVSDLLAVLSENDRLKSLGFIDKCKEKVILGESFPQAWKESIEADSELCRLLSGHCSYLVRLGAEIGATDLEGQLSCCEYYKQIFEKELAVREENSKKYAKLFPTLGIMLGITAAIIII